MLTALLVEVENIISLRYIYMRTNIPLLDSLLVIALYNEFN